MAAKTFDLGPLLEAVGGDRDIMHQVIGMFVTSSHDNLEAMREAISKHDARSVKVAAHHLKGSLLEFGAAEAVALASELEKMGEAQKLGGADAVWRELETAVREIVAALNQSEYLLSA